MKINSKNNKGKIIKNFRQIVAIWKFLVVTYPLFNVKKKNDMLLKCSIKWLVLAIKLPTSKLAALRRQLQAGFICPTSRTFLGDANKWFPYFLFHNDADPVWCWFSTHCHRSPFFYVSSNISSHLLTKIFWNFHFCTFGHYLLSMFLLKPNAFCELLSYFQFRFTLS